jgi:hypothetical protein
MGNLQIGLMKLTPSGGYLVADELGRDEALRRDVLLNPVDHGHEHLPGRVRVGRSVAQALVAERVGAVAAAAMGHTAYGEETVIVVHGVVRVRIHELLDERVVVQLGPRSARHVDTICMARGAQPSCEHLSFCWYGVNLVHVVYTQ